MVLRIRTSRMWRFTRPFVRSCSCRWVTVIRDVYSPVGTFVQTVVTVLELRLGFPKLGDGIGVTLSVLLFAPALTVGFFHSKQWLLSSYQRAVQLRVQLRWAEGIVSAMANEHGGAAMLVTKLQQRGIVRLRMVVDAALSA